MIVSLFRRLTGGRPAARRAPARFVPGCTALEGRDVPSTVPFQETLALTGVTTDPVTLHPVAHYAGQATHLGAVTAELDVVANTFVKHAANGADLVGFGVYDPGSTSTGTLTYTGGTGRLAGTTGTSRFVIAADGGVTVSGTLSLNQPAAAGTHTIPFRVTGTGPATGGLPLVPGLSSEHGITDGLATHLGRYTGTGTFTLGTLNVSATGAVSGTFEGSFGFVAANGDVLTFTYGAGLTGVFSGQLSSDGATVEGVVFDAIFAYDAAHSTGRFANLSGGSFRMIAEADSVPLAGGAPGYTGPFVYSWSGEGTLEFGTLKKK